jgi:uncharacterized membrane protein
VALLAVFAVAWLVLLTAAPILPVPAAALMYAIGSRICHQIPARSFHVFGSQLPVCGRCLGIYAGAAAGAIAAACAGGRASSVMRASPRILLAIGAAPTAITLALEWSGAWPGSNLARAGAGVPLGAAVALVAARAAATLHYGRCELRRPIASSRPPTPI